MSPTDLPRLPQIPSQLGIESTTSSPRNCSSRIPSKQQIPQSKQRVPGQHPALHRPPPAQTLHTPPQWVPICVAAPKVFPGRVEAFSFSRSSQPKKLQMIFKPPRRCSGIEFRLAESQSRGGIASLEPPPSDMHCYFQVLHVEQPEGARPPAQGPEGSHTHQGVPRRGNCPEPALCGDGGCA